MSNRGHIFVNKLQQPGALGVILGAAVLAVPQQAAAQADTAEIAQVRAEIAQLQQELNGLVDRLELLEADDAQAESPSPQAPAAASPTPRQDRVAFAGAPEITAPGGWSFKPFGRIQADAGLTTLPASDADDGFGSELRRARIGLEGDMPGGFGYKVEIDFAGGSAELTDAILTYANDGLTLTAGQHNPFQSLEELTSSRWSSFIERAAFTDAFGFERRLGLSAQYAAGDLLFQAGLFSDNIADLPGESWSADGRIVYAPMLGDAQLHLGASLHHLERESGDTARFRQRPLVHFTSVRPLDTGAFAAGSDFGLGLEGAFVSGPFHAAAEAYWNRVERPGLADNPLFFGGYAELGYFLTPGDSRGYKGGKFARTRPADALSAGGPGAWQIVIRYDHLDLDDGAITGGRQHGYFASLVWVPTDYTRLMLNYGRLAYSDASIPLADGGATYDADVLGLRAQVDF